MHQSHDLRWLVGSACLLSIPLLAHPESEDTADLPPVLDTRLSVEPSTGSLTWALPLGVVPGEIPIPVVFKLDRPSLRGPQAASTSRLEGLDFGYVTSPLDCTSGGLDMESTQQLEDGTRLKGGDWQGPALDAALPASFGLAGPKGGIVSDKSGTYGFYAATLANLGKWGSLVADLTTERRFMVLLDRDRARVYAYQSLLKVMVPVLWLDRFDHRIAFRWQQGDDKARLTLAVRAQRADGKGVQVCWRLGGNPCEEVDLLRADYFGIQHPSLLVRGYPGSLEHQPPQPETCGWSGCRAWRPTRIQVGPPGSFSTPGSVPVPPGSTDTRDLQAKEWTFSYEGTESHELTTLQDPRGLTTTFEYRTYQIPESNTAFRGIHKMSSLDLETGVSHGQAWARSFSGNLGEPWTVQHQASYSDGHETEHRTTLYTFVHEAASFSKAILQKVELQGANGTCEKTTYEPVAAGVVASGWCERHQATGRPERETCRRAPGEHGTGFFETIRVGGVHVQSTTSTYVPSGFGLGPKVLASRSIQRGSLPTVLESWHHSTSGLLSRQTIKAGKEECGWSYGYDPEGKLVTASMIASWAAESGPVHTYAPGPLGPTTHAISGTLLAQPLNEKWEYDSAGRVVSQTDAQGIKTVYAYDPWGRILALERAGSPKLECAYPDERTRLWTQGRFKGKDQFDGFGRLRSRDLPNGTTQIYETDTLGRRVLVREACGQAERVLTRRRFDAVNRLIVQEAGSRQSFRYAYGAAGPLQTVTIHSDDEIVCTQTWDPWGQLLSTAQPGLTTGFTYNEHGQVTRIRQTDTQGRSQVRTFTYDSLGKLIRVKVPETGTTILSDFNVLGQPGRIMDASRRTQWLTYDALGRIVTRTNGKLRLTNHYQGPLLVGRSSTEGTAQTFSYAGPGGRMDGETLLMDRIIHKVGYRYEANGLLDQVKYPNGATVGYVYDEVGRVSQVTYDGTPLADLKHDGWGNLAVLQFASGAKSTWRMDVQGQHIKGWEVAFKGGIEYRRYGYDSSDQLRQAGEWSLAHDGSGRLSLATGFGLTFAHLHDAFGNNIAHSVTGQANDRFNAFSMAPPSDNRIPGIQSNGGLTGWLVDPNGEAAQIGTGVSSKNFLSLAWDGLGRLSSVQDSLTGAIRRYLYAPSGLRVGSSSSSNPCEDRKYMYTDHGLLLGEYQRSHGWFRNVVHLGELAIAEIDAKGVHELHSDHLGTPRVITCGANAALEGRQTFGPYGETMEGASCTEGYRPLTGYTGHIQTEPTGLIYMRGRFYSPAWHRFLNSDHGADPGSLNQFAYVGGNPFQAIDPTGLVKKIPMRGGMIDGGSAIVVVTAPMPGPAPTVPVPMPSHLPPPIPVIHPFGLGPLPMPSPYPVGIGGVKPLGPSSGTKPPPPPPVKKPAPADPINPARLDFKTPVEKPGTPAGSLAAAVADGNYTAAASMLKAQANQQKIANLQNQNDVMKTQMDTKAIRDYLTTIGTDVVKAAVISGAICGEAGMAIGAVLGFGVGGAPLGGVGAAGGAIIAGVGALSYTGVTEGIKLQKTLDKIKADWKLNYNAIQNYSDLNCLGNPPEIRY